MQLITGYRGKHRESEASHSLLLFETAFKNTFGTAVLNLCESADSLLNKHLGTAL
jgi:hypothetical protein